MKAGSNTQKASQNIGIVIGVQKKVTPLTKINKMQILSQDKTQTKINQIYKVLNDYENDDELANIKLPVQKMNLNGVQINNYRNNKQNKIINNVKRNELKVSGFYQSRTPGERMKIKSTTDFGQIMVSTQKIQKQESLDASPASLKIYGNQARFSHKKSNFKFNNQSHASSIATSPAYNENQNDFISSEIQIVTGLKVNDNKMQRLKEKMKFNAPYKNINIQLLSEPNTFQPSQRDISPITKNIIVDERDIEKEMPQIIHTTISDNSNKANDHTFQSPNNLMSDQNLNSITSKNSKLLKSDQRGQQSFWEKSMEQENKNSMLNDLRFMIQYGKDNNVSRGSEEESNFMLQNPLHREESKQKDQIDFLPGQTLTNLTQIDGKIEQVLSTIQEKMNIDVRQSVGGATEIQHSTTSEDRSSLKYLEKVLHDPNNQNNQENFIKSGKSTDINSISDYLKPFGLLNFQTFQSAKRKQKRNHEAQSVWQPVEGPHFKAFQQTFQNNFQSSNKFLKSEKRKKIRPQTRILTQQGSLAQGGLFLKGSQANLKPKNDMFQSEPSQLIIRPKSSKIYHQITLDKIKTFQKTFSHASQIQDDLLHFNSRSNCDQSQNQQTEKNLFLNMEANQFIKYLNRNQTNNLKTQKSPILEKIQQNQFDSRNPRELNMHNFDLFNSCKIDQTPVVEDYVEVKKRVRPTTAHCDGQSKNQRRLNKLMFRREFLESDANYRIKSIKEAVNQNYQQVIHQLKSKQIKGVSNYEFALNKFEDNLEQESIKNESLAQFSSSDFERKVMVKNLQIQSEEFIQIDPISDSNESLKLQFRKTSLASFKELSIQKPEFLNVASKVSFQSLKNDSKEINQQTKNKDQQSINQNFNYIRKNSKQYVQKRSDSPDLQSCFLTDQVQISTKEKISNKLKPEKLFQKIQNPQTKTNNFQRKLSQKIKNDQLQKTQSNLQVQRQSKIIVSKQYVYPEPQSYSGKEEQLADERILVTANQSELIQSNNKKVEQIVQYFNEINGEDPQYNKKINQNATNNITNLTKELTRINQDCIRLLTTDDQFPTINIGRPQQIELDQDTPLYYRINIEGQISPLKFEISYQSKQKNLDVFLSTFDKNPKNQSCEMKLINPNNFLLHSDKIGQTDIQAQIKIIENKPGLNLLQKQYLLKQLVPNHHQEQYFKDQYLYLGLNSFSGCSINFVIINVPSRSHLNKVKLDNHRSKQLNEVANVNKHFTYDDPYFREMLEMQENKQQKAKEFKQRTELAREHELEIYGDFEARLEILKERKEFRREKQLLVSSNKNMIDHKKLQYQYFEIVKWDRLKQIKDQKLEQWCQFFKRSKYSTNFTKVMQAYFIYQKIHQIFNEYKIIQQRELYIKFLQIRAKFLFHQKVRIRGDTISRRNQTLATNMFNSFSCFYIDTYKQTAKKTMFQFIEKFSNLLKLKEKILVMHALLRKIQQKLIQRVQDEKEQSSHFYDKLWHDLKNQLCLECYSHTKNQLLQKCAEAISKISDQSKELVVKLIVYRWKLENRKLYIQWFIGYQKGPEHIQDYPNKLQTYKQLFPQVKDLLKEIDDFMNDIPQKLQDEIFGHKKKGSKSKDRKKNNRSPGNVSEEQSTEKTVEKKNIFSLVREVTDKINYDIPVVKIDEFSDKFYRKKMIIRASQISEMELQDFFEQIKFRLTRMSVS